jgi:quinol monooxygenase YgiN
VYKDSAAFDAHRGSPHFVAYQEVAEKALLSKTLTRYTTKNV